jgi:Uma2 family endonuclease
MASILVDEQCLIPDGIGSLADFRRWAVSPEFPRRGRIDWIGSRIEVDMSPEDIFMHGTLKTEIVGVLWTLAKDQAMHLFTGETRISSVAGDVSSEPDVVAVSDAALDADRVRLVPSASGKPDRFIELEGGPDLIVEFVSDSSVAKDTRRLPAAYHAAGVREFWLVDARGTDVLFTIHSRAADGFVATPPADGFAHSEVFGRAFAIRRSRNPHGRPVYDLLVRPGR